MFNIILYYEYQLEKMEKSLSSLDWNKIIETLIPLLIILVLGWIAKIVWHSRVKILRWIKRQRLNLFPVNFNVAFSLDFKDGLNSGNYFNQILHNVNDIIDQCGLHSQIIIKDFSDIQKFNNKEQAEKFVVKKSLNLIIWGGFTNDVLKLKGENINEIKLNFTYQHPQDTRGKIGKMILLDISSRMAKKNYWNIVESDSFRDIKIISNNLLDISLYIIALTLKLYGNLEKSLNLFEQLYQNLLKRNDEFSKTVIPHLINLYELLIIENGQNRKNYILGSEICRKLLKLNENSFFGIANLATFQVKLGNIKESEELVSRLQKLYPREPVTQVDLAYFRILRKNYKKAFEHYSNLLKYQVINFKPQEVIEFLFDEYDKLNEPGFLYGIGVISNEYWDKDLARKTLGQFLRKSSESKYKLMYREAKRILRN